MEFKHLEAFVYVVEKNSFSKAAEALFLTQPTISAHIATLEKTLNTTLIQRSTKIYTYLQRVSNFTLMQKKFLPYVMKFLHIFKYLVLLKT